MLWRSELRWKSRFTLIQNIFQKTLRFYFAELDRKLKSFFNGMRRSEVISKYEKLTNIQSVMDENKIST